MALTKIIVNVDTGQTAKAKLDAAFNAIDLLITDLDAEEAARIVLEAEYDAHAADTANPHAVTKTQVGLGNCDNTSDANKPLSTAATNANNTLQTNIDAKQNANANSTLNDKILAPYAGPISINNITYLNELLVFQLAVGANVTLDGGATGFPVGGTITIYNNDTSLAAVTVVAGGGVTLKGDAGPLGVTVLADTTSIWKRLPGDEWLRVL